MWEAITFIKQDEDIQVKPANIYYINLFSISFIA